jgi:hypothetical protein
MQSLPTDRPSERDAVHYYDHDGGTHFQRARAVIIAGYSIETPRLLAQHWPPGFENELANSKGRCASMQSSNNNAISQLFDS